MNRPFSCLLVFAIALSFHARAADSADEELQLVGILKSSASPQEKDQACARLKWIGTTASVPALAMLLPDESLSHSARFALESMQAAEAGQALVDALDKTKAMTRVGIINSLGSRREIGAAAVLGKLLKDQDLDVACAAATSLGRIGGAGPLALLEGAGTQTGNRLQAAIADGRLRCATDLLHSGDKASALEAFKRLAVSDQPTHIQLAANRGVILCAGDGALKQMSEAISGTPGPAQMASLQLVHEITVPGVAEALAELLSKVPPQVQVSLIGGLAQRQEPSVAKPIAALTSSKDADVRVAALGALGAVGDATVVSLLAEHAATGSDAERMAARDSLANLNRGNVSEALVQALPGAQPPVQAELARALGDRGDVAAVPRLFALAREGNDSARQAALRALARLADQPDLAAAVALVSDAKNDGARTEAAEALNAIVQRIKAKHGRVDPAPLIAVLGSGPPEVRVALLPVCSGLIDPGIRASLRAGAGSGDAKVRNAAIRAICDTSDAGLLGDLLEIARSPKEGNLRSLAVAACVRMATQEESVKLKNSEKIDALKSILASNPSIKEKKILLSGFGAIADPESLNVSQTLLSEKPVATEAARAVIRIASTVSDNGAAADALKKVIETSEDETARKEAQAALKTVQSRAGFITAWQIAGPYRQDGKDFSALFDVAFAPEPGSGTTDPGATQWKALTAEPDAKPAGTLDLLKAIGGEQCVAYARSWVRSDHEQQVQLEMGSDDGIKVWLNDKQVFARNISRALQPGSDKAPVVLNAGWNVLLVKVTQNNQGWGFCVRMAKPDGSAIDGLQFDAARDSLASASTAARVDTAVSQSSGGNLVPLVLKLPSPAFKGTPKDVQIGSYVEPLSDKPRPQMMVPPGLKNIAPTATISRSDKNATAEMLAKLTDGDKESGEQSIIFLRKGTQWVQMDLGSQQELFAVVLWHAHNAAKVYHDVIVQVSDDPDFIDKVRTLFNNDQDNSSGLGAGTDREYFETHEGKLIDAKGARARYIRFYSKGSTESPLNEYTEIEVYGRPAN